MREKGMRLGPRNMARWRWARAPVFFSESIEAHNIVNDKETVLTKEGLAKLEEELEDLKTVHRREVNERIRHAKEFGDISENAEYEDAKQEQAFVEGRIMKVEAMIRSARIIEADDSPADEVHLGATVRIKESKGAEAREFVIVGSTEADPTNNRLSNESPLGNALIGRRKGDIVDVNTPGGMRQYKIEAIGSKKRPQAEESFLTRLESEERGRREAELREARRENLAALRELGHDPFLVTRFDVTAHAADVAERFAALSADGASDDTVALAGRIMALRKMGKNVFFADLIDRTGKLQLYVRKDAVGDAAFAAFDTLDIGDVVGASGTVFRSKAGELTLRVAAFEVLVKALLPLPDKWHGLTDVDKRIRQRYLDLIVNPEVRDVFMTRSRILAEMRRFIDARGFLECETPTLLHVAGGASARPFRTHSNALDIALDLRIATELNLKRLIVGGLERVYEIGRIFRNEGIDTTHNPEFTMLELYAAYWSVHEMLEFNEELIAHLVRVRARWRDADVRHGHGLVQAPLPPHPVPRRRCARGAASSAQNCSNPRARPRSSGAWACPLLQRTAMRSTRSSSGSSEDFRT